VSAGPSTAHASGRMMGGMGALIATAGTLVVIAGALVLLARIWPHSSRQTGYRITGHDRADGEPPVPEDDDARWHWKD
jgi:hypothetical protein